MPVYRCTGADVHVGQAREWWAQAATPEAARALVAARGLVVESVTESDAAARPPGAPLFLTPHQRPTTRPGVRRTRLILLGMLLGLVAIGGFLWVVKASKHLGRGRPPIQGLESGK